LAHLPVGPPRRRCGVSPRSASSHGRARSCRARRAQVV